MRHSARSLTFGLLCAAIVSVASTPVMAQAAAGSMGPLPGSARISNSVEPVQFRDGRRYRGYGRRGNGGNIALGIGAAIIGGIVLSEAARAEHRSAHGGDWDRCAQTYRSFDPGTGLYTGYDGVQRTCPYLH